MSAKYTSIWTREEDADVCGRRRRRRRREQRRREAPPGWRGQQTCEEPKYIKPL